MAEQWVVERQAPPADRLVMLSVWAGAIGLAWNFIAFLAIWIFWLQIMENSSNWAIVLIVGRPILGLIAVSAGSLAFRRPILAREQPKALLGCALGVLDLLLSLGIFYDFVEQLF